jgi:hypothetical protein
VIRYEIVQKMDANCGVDCDRAVGALLYRRVGFKDSCGGCFDGDVGAHVFICVAKASW